MKCKVCGYSPEKKERFCSKCGSYFIDADAPQDSHEWKGIIAADGTILPEKAVSSVQTRSASGKYSSQATMNAWSVLGIVFSAILLVINIIDMITDEIFFIAGIPFLVLAIISIFKANRTKMKWLAILITFLSLLLFFIRMYKS